MSREQQSPHQNGPQQTSILDHFALAGLKSPEPSIFLNAFDIPGLTYVENFINAQEEVDLLRQINAKVWSTSLSRRTQQYGHRYDYVKKTLQHDCPDFPDEWQGLVQRVYQPQPNLQYFDRVPDQIIVNEYHPGQGIASHIDKKTCFGPVVASLSLQSDIGMTFVLGLNQTKTVVLKRRSLIFLTEKARNDYMHGIVARERDRDILDIQGVKHDIIRQRRISITFRTIL